MTRPYREIASSDVGRALFEAFGRAWPVSGFIGRVLPQDVGKRVYLSAGVLQVESAEQFERRVRNATGEG